MRITLILIYVSQISSLKKEKKNKWGKYTKRSKRTLKRCENAHEKMESKRFFPLDKFMRYKGFPVKQDKHAPELNKIIDLEELKEDSDEENQMNQDICTHISVSDTSEVKSEENLPGTLINQWPAPSQTPHMHHVQGEQ